MIALLSGGLAGGRDNPGISAAAAAFPARHIRDQGDRHLTRRRPAPGYDSDPPTSGAHVPRPVDQQRGRDLPTTSCCRRCRWATSSSCTARRAPPGRTAGDRRPGRAALHARARGRRSDGDPRPRRANLATITAVAWTHMLALQQRRGPADLRHALARTRRAPPYEHGPSATSSGAQPPAAPAHGDRHPRGGAQALGVVEQTRPPTPRSSARGAGRGRTAWIVPAVIGRMKLVWLDSPIDHRLLVRRPRGTCRSRPPSRRSPHRRRRARARPVASARRGPAPRPHEPVGDLGDHQAEQLVEAAAGSGRGSSTSIAAAEDSPRPGGRPLLTAGSLRLGRHGDV